MLGGTCGSWLGAVTLFISMFNLLGNGTAQIVAGAANTYSINPILTKRCLARLPCHTVSAFSVQYLPRLFMACQAPQPTRPFFPIRTVPGHARAAPLAWPRRFTATPLAGC